MKFFFRLRMYKYWTEFAGLNGGYSVDLMSDREGLRMLLVMLSMQPQVSSYQPPFNQDTESAFQLGHFDRFVDGHGEIVCSLSGFRYIFGPEAIDLGPCCDPCDENWVRVLRHGKFFGRLSESFT